jgi:hypothetical protein
MSCTGPKPATFFSIAGRRTSTRRPSASATVSARIHGRVAPYLSERAPLELQAIAPPSDDSSSLVGSGGKSSPCAAARALDVAQERARLGAHDAPLRVDLEHAVERAQRQHDPPVGDRAADVARLRAGGGHRRPGAARLAQHVGDLVVRARAGHRLGDEAQPRGVLGEALADGGVALDGRRHAATST